MPVLETPGHPRFRLSALAGVLCLAAATSAWAAAGDPTAAVPVPSPAPASPVANGYVCLSNSCVEQKALAAPVASAPVVDPRRPPITREQAEAAAKASLLSRLTPEQRAGARFSVQIRPNGMNGIVTVDYPTADGARGTMNWVIGFQPSN